MPPLSISTLAADEYATAVAFVNTTSPERAERAISWHHADQQAGEGDLRRFVAIKDGGQMVGYGAIWPARSPRFRLDLVVDLVTAQDVGAPLLEHLERELRRVGAATAQARAGTVTLTSARHVTWGIKAHSRPETHSQEPEMGQKRGHSGERIADTRSNRS